MKNRKFSSLRCASLAAPLIIALSSSAYAQLTWDPDNNQTNDGGSGIWDVATTSNWWNGVAVSNTTWTNGSDAIFGNSGGDYQVDLTSAGVTVGDLTFGGGGTLEFKGSTAAGSTGDIITINSGGATWDTGGGEIEFFNDGNDNNTLLSMTSGDTLMVQGGGTFDTGQNPQNNAFGTWQVGGAILDVTSATVVRADTTTVGQFDTVKMADGARFIHERNSDRTYSNNWELGAGTVSFENRFQRNYVLNGVISGTGGLKAVFMGNRTLTLGNDANSFSGGVEVSTSAILRVDTVARLGDPENNITLSEGGILRLNGVDLGSTREIILSGTGGSISNDSNPNTFGGKITGAGNLQIGDPLLNTLSNKLTLTGNTSDYTGTTTIHNGTLELGIANALPTTTSLTIGGNGNLSILALNGFNQTVAALNSTGFNSPKQIINGTTTASVFTINGATDSTYSAQLGNTGVPGTDDDNNFSVVKAGAGTLDVSAAGARFNGGLTVTGGIYRINSDGDLGAVPTLPTADNITLDGGTLQTQLTASFEIDANRLITLGALGGTFFTTTPSGAWSVTYNGVISGPGSLTKSAAQSLNLGGTNTYTGETFITGGTLRLTGSLTSDVTVQSGVFVAGDFTTGTGSGSVNALTFEAGGKMASFINSDSMTAGAAVVPGVVDIDSASTLSVVDEGTTVLTIGTKLTLIDYTGGSLTGEFAGLADGASLVVGSNTFMIDYDDGTTVTLTATISDPYASWATSKGLTPPNAGKGDDKDNDGIENQLEWVLGGNPLASDTNILPTVEKIGTNLVFTFDRADDTVGEVALVVQYGSDLVGWADEVVPVGTSGIFTINDASDPDEVIATIPVGAATLQFARLKTTSP